MPSTRRDRSPRLVAVPPEARRAVVSSQPSRHAQRLAQPPGRALARARRLGHRPAQGWLPVASPSLQRLTFSRFQGWSRLVNWAYSPTETALRALERRTRDALVGLGRAVRDGDFPLGLTPRVEALEDDFRQVAEGTYDVGDYAATRLKLGRIFEETDQLSATIARYDIPLAKGFNADQSEALARFKLSRDSSLEDVVELVARMTGRQELTDLPAVRELLDVLGQWVSDAVLKAPKLTEAVALKRAILEAGAFAQEAYLAAFVKQDRKRGRTAYLRALLTLEGGIDPTVLYALAEVTQGVAYPKLREASRKPYDTASMMLARAFLADGFVPDLVVGLPTGGVHAATRVVASLALVGAPRPRLWTTRPQGVKKESKEFMKGTKADAILSPTEIELLQQWRPKTIAIVDDGFESGGTLVRAKDFYSRALKADVRTGVIEASTRQMGDEVVRENDQEELEKITNPADYVVVAGLGVAGPTGVLETVVNGTPNLGSNTNPALSGKTAIIDSKKNIGNFQVGELLDS